MALDVNAIGGLLLEIFGSDMTSAEASCAACGAVGPVAKTTVPPGAGNGRPLQQMHERAYGRRAVCGLNCVELSGVAALEVDPRR
jgi:hypothetical protein